jgi:hypothetical protein
MPVLEGASVYVFHLKSIKDNMVDVRYSKYNQEATVFIYFLVPASIGGLPSPPRIPWSQPLMTYWVHLKEL